MREEITEEQFAIETIVSTSKGIRDGKAARRDRLGGELLCVVW